MPGFSHRWFEHINDLDSANWDTFFGTNPFTSHAFLSALENSLCVSPATGWQPCHLAVYEENYLVALAPGYIKTHSYGEYVFDWAWADAYARHGLNYYPKWLCGSPFTPVEGQRLAIKHSHPERVYDYFSQLIEAECQKQGWSSWHINFCQQTQMAAMTAQQALPRLGVQFQWFNQGYSDFDAFLAQLRSSRRKVVKKERVKVQQQHISIEWLHGSELTDKDMEMFHHFYQATYLKRSGHHGYLNRAFFISLLDLMPDNIVLMFARREQQIVAATLSFKDEQTLYGRYWGALEEVDCLHFELCYYQGIDYCIQHHLQCFHSGAQGEHKISRGFEPVFTHSVHGIMQPDFRQAIAEYLQEERQHTQLYQQQCQGLLPFKNE